MIFLVILFDHMNRNRFDPILARGNMNCSTMENLRYVNSAVNERQERQEMF